MVHFTYTDALGREVTRPIVASDEHWYYVVGPVPRGAYDPSPPYDVVRAERD